jgi:hypothetical protein
LPLNRKTSSDGAEWEHAKLAIQEFGGWIRNADAKITILAGALGVSLTFTLPRVALAVGNAGTSACVCTFLLFFALGIAGCFCAALSGYNLYRALSPNSKPRAGAAISLNRFSWPSMAAETTAPSPTQIGALNEAWEQAHTLAKIASAKYSRFRHALRLFVAYLVLFGCVGLASQAVPLSSAIL